MDASVHAPASYSRTVSIESGLKMTYVDVVSHIRLPGPVSVLACLPSLSSPNVRIFMMTLPDVVSLGSGTFNHSQPGSDLHEVTH